jgi:transcription antitermination protein NusB
MPRTRVETRARARVLPALYAWDVRGEERLDRVATQIWDDLSIAPDEPQIASRLIATIIKSGRELDEQIVAVTTNWRLERLGVVDRCVLRLGAAELSRGETPTLVVIQESVHLAERYGTLKSAKFVNGVLDALARRMGRL